MNFLSESVRVVQGIPPVADFTSPSEAGLCYSDIFNCKGAGNATFIVQRGVSAGEVCTVTVEACDNVSATNHTAIAFWYKQISAADVEGALTHSDSSGYSSTGVTNSMDIIEVDTQALGVLGYGYVRLKMTETTDQAALGGVICLLSQLRYSGGLLESPIT